MAGLSSETSLDPQDLRMGARLRARRRNCGLTLEAVAAAGGVSAAQLSLIERGRASPALRELRGACRALGLFVAWLFADETEPGGEAGAVVRRHRRSQLEPCSGKMRKELLAPDLGGALQILSITMEAGAESPAEPYRHAGEEGGLVLAGTLALLLGADRYVLENGDSFRFDSAAPHRFLNAGSDVCRVVWITTPPFY